MAIDDIPEPKLTDAPVLFEILIGARKYGNRKLETLARNCLRDYGIHVTFTREPRRSESKSKAK